MVRAGLACVLAVLVVGWTPHPAAAATCSDYSNQADAQRAMDTRDADGDGIYCESLPCPCLKPGESGGGDNPTPAPKPKPKVSCTRPPGVQRIIFSKSKYPNIRRHYIFAVDRGWPRVMVVNRKGADDRRDRLLEGFPTRAGFDRDEYPAAVGRGKANGDQSGLVRGINPIGWMADVAYVPSSENRSHGSALGAKLRAFCDGTRFRYVFS
ncbi:MAG: hypothetical protein V7607_6726 [Solirubrobacteraceae bacterium]